jgi:energy-converting hydrogenase A subunit M
MCFLKDVGGGEQIRLDEAKLVLDQTTESLLLNKDYVHTQESGSKHKCPAHPNRAESMQNLITGSKK